MRPYWVFLNERKKDDGEMRIRKKGKIGNTAPSWTDQNSQQQTLITNTVLHFITILLQNKNKSDKYRRKISFDDPSESRSV